MLQSPFIRRLRKFTTEGLVCKFPDTQGTLVLSHPLSSYLEELPFFTMWFAANTYFGILHLAIWAQCHALCDHFHAQFEASQSEIRHFK